MKKLITYLVSRRNKNFKLDEQVDSTMLIGFIWDTSCKLIRGLKLILKGKKPRFALLGKNTKWQYAHKISFGKMLKLGDNVKLSALGKKGIVLGHNVSIGDYSRVIVSTTLNELGEHIILGNNVGIGEFAYLGGGGGLSIGDNCIVGQYLSCHPENHRYANPHLPIKDQGVVREGISIGENCWIGSKVTILDGVKIGNNCIIAGGAVVNKSFPDNSIIGGVPARLIKQTYSHENNSSKRLRYQSV